MRIFAKITLVGAKYSKLRIMIVTPYINLINIVSADISSGIMHPGFACIQSDQDIIR